MSLLSVARSIYSALADDQHALDAIRTERNALAKAIATSANGATVVTSATVNGQMFAATNDLKPLQRLQVLKMVCHMADNETAISSTTEPLL